MATLRDEQKTYVRSVLEKTGWSIKYLAEKADVTPPTISAFLNSKKATHHLSAKTLKGIEKASGLSYGPEPKAFSVREVESEPYVNDNAPKDLDFVSQMLGRANGIDPWILRSRALETAGYLPGDILIVDLNREHKPGDVVCAQLYDWARSKADTIFRLWEPPCLIAATYDGKLRKPFIPDNQDVIIKGVVIASIRPRTARAA